MKKTIIGFTILIAFGCASSDKGNSVNYSSERITEAQPFAKGVISTEEHSEFEITFSPDGLKAYFTRREPEEKQKIFETEFINGNWSEPKVAAFSTDRDETPSITPNGELFFFGSERPIPNKPNKGNFDMNIWMMKRTNNGWSNPEPLPYPINDVQIEGEEWPSSNSNLIYPLDNETFYYSTMVRGTNSIQLFETSLKDGKFSKPIKINGLFDDTKYWIYSPVVSPDGNYLVFNSFGVPGGLGGEDLYVSRRIQNGWSKAKPIGNDINSKDEEGGARFSRDGRYFFFTKGKYLENNEYGEWDIYYIETEYLNLDKLFE
jgi:Tol biopolymer transport system component